MTAPIQDLRDAIALLQQHDNQYLETDHPVDPNAELAGVYRHIGAGGTVKRPTRIGPAMMFNNIKGYPHSRILVGMHASRQRAALLLGCEASQLALEVGKAVKKPVAPVVVPASSAPCQEQIFLADDPDFDLRTLLPAPTNTPIDAGPFFCLGLALASDPDDASLTDVTIHRLCVQGRDELSMFLAAGRHIEVFRQKAEAAGKPLPITTNMGLNPAIYTAACFEAPSTPFGHNELSAACAKLDFAGALHLTVDGNGLRLERASLQTGETLTRYWLGEVHHLRVLCDRSSVEIFINHGEGVMSSRYFPDQPARVRFEGASDITLRYWSLRTCMIE